MMMARLLGLMLLLCSTQVKAWNLTSDFQAGLYWTSLPISISVIASNATEGNELYQIVSDEMKDWEDATGQAIWDVGSGYAASAGGSIIRWSSNFSADTGYDPVNTLAVTIRYQEGPYWAKTEIILNGGMTTLRHNQNTLRKVILHELGHTFGLDHSASSTAMMYAYVSNVEHLSDDDVNGAIEAISINHNRSATGYVAPQFAATTKRQQSSLSKIMPSCGTVAPPGSSMGGGLSLLGSLLTGLFPFLRRRRSDSSQ